MTLKIEKVSINELEFIGIHIPYNDTTNREKIKTIDARAWHPQEKLWLVPYDTATYERLKSTFTDGLEIMPAETPRVIKPAIMPPKLEVKPDYKKGSILFSVGKSKWCRNKIENCCRYEF